jgi:hypothetical protein
VTYDIKIQLKHNTKWQNCLSKLGTVMLQGSVADRKDFGLDPDPALIKFFALTFFSMKFTLKLAYKM